MKKFLESKILHPFLITIFPALFLYTSNLGETKFRMAIPSIVAILVTSLLLALLFWLIFKNIIKAGICSSLIIFSFLTYQYFRPVFSFFGLKNNSIVFDSTACVIWLVILTFFLFLVWKTKKLDVWNYLLNITSLILLTSFLISLISSSPSNNKVDPKKISSYYQNQIKATKPTTAEMPDIYYMILDGYGRNDILNSKFHYDNSQFTNFLKKQRFFVADKATSNYGQTALSLSSAMNLDYLDTLDGTKNTSHSLAGALVGNSALINHLEKLDYRTISFSTDYEFATVTDVDENKTPAYWSEFNQVMLNRSTISDIPFLKKYIFGWLSVGQRSKKINYVFEHVADEAESNVPKFTFFHVIAPHPPFIFDAFGLRKNLDFDKIVQHDCDGYFSQTHDSPTDYQKDYSNQVQYVNKLAETAVTQIINNSKRPLIIILQGDHGPGSSCNLGDMSKTDLPERMSILNAYYFSDQKYDKLYPEITPVNTFRVIFDQYLGTNLPLLEDKNYFSLWKTPYEFIDVTDKINKK